MPQPVQISFECVPLRAIPRLDVPLDASVEFQRRCERIQAAVDQHGIDNSYYLLGAQCVFCLANSEIEGMLRFRFEGTVLTDPGDRRAVKAELEVSLVAETCGGAPEAVTDWFSDRVRSAVLVEFNHYLASERFQIDSKRQEAQIRDEGATESGFLGMYL